MVVGSRSQQPGAECNLRCKFSWNFSSRKFIKVQFWQLTRLFVLNSVLCRHLRRHRWFFFTLLLSIIDRVSVNEKSHWWRMYALFSTSGRYHGNARRFTAQPEILRPEIIITEHVRPPSNGTTHPPIWIVSVAMGIDRITDINPPGQSNNHQPHKPLIPMVVFIHQ